VTYEIEVADPRAPGLADRIASALQDAVKVRGAVRFVPTGSLGEGGKRIDDQRKWS
jgi:hypothetical protein